MHSQYLHVNENATFYQVNVPVSSDRTLGVSGKEDRRSSDRLETCMDTHDALTNRQIVLVGNIYTEILTKLLPRRGISKTTCTKLQHRGFLFLYTQFFNHFAQSSPIKYNLYSITSSFKLNCGTELRLTLRCG